MRVEEGVVFTVTVVMKVIALLWDSFLNYWSWGGISYRSRER